MGEKISLRGVTFEEGARAISNRIRKKHGLPVASSAIPSFGVYDIEKESFLHKGLSREEASAKAKALNDTAKRTAKTKGQSLGVDDKFVVREI